METKLPVIYALSVIVVFFVFLFLQYFSFLPLPSTSSIHFNHASNFLLAERSCMVVLIRLLKLCVLVIMFTEHQFY